MNYTRRINEINKNVHINTPWHINMNINFKQWIAVLAVLFISCPSHAASLTGTVIDHNGKPVANAVISLTSSKQISTLSSIGKSDKEISDSGIASAVTTTAIMDQINKQFVPYNLPVQAGTLVSFPNKDNIKHHVYSFSPAKRFELKLYAGANAEPVKFDRPGIVAMGCNIHDWMLGYIYVLDTPYFAKTDNNGTLSIRNLPEDNHYIVSVWHPRLKGNPEKYDQQISLKSIDNLNISFSIPLKRERKRTRPFDFEEEDY